LQISFYIYVEVFLWSSYSLCDLIRSDHCLCPQGSNEIVRVMSMGKSYHMACYDGKSDI